MQPSDPRIPFKGEPIRARVVGLVALAPLLLALLVHSIWPRTFAARGTIVVRAAHGNPGPATAAALVSAQQRILTAPELLRRVARVHDDPGGVVADLDRLRRIEAGFEATSDPLIGLVRVRLVDRDPVWAETTLDEILRQFLSFRSDLSATGDGSSVLRERADEYRNDLRAAEKELQGRRAEVASALDAERELTANAERLVARQKELDELELEAVELETALRPLRLALAEDRIQYFAFLNLDALTGIGSRLSELRAELVRLRRAFRDGMGGQDAVEAGIRETYDELRFEARKVLASRADRQKGIEARIQSLRAAISELEARNRALHERGVELRRAEREARLEAYSYETFRRRAEDLRIQGTLDTAAETSQVRILSWGRGSATPASPRPGPIFFVGVLLSLTCGCVAERTRRARNRARAEEEARRTAARRSANRAVREATYPLVDGGLYPRKPVSALPKGGTTERALALSPAPTLRQLGPPGKAGAPPVRTLPVAGRPGVCTSTSPATPARPGVREATTPAAPGPDPAGAADPGAATTPRSATKTAAPAPPPSATDAGVATESSMPANADPATRANEAGNAEVEPQVAAATQADAATQAESSPNPRMGSGSVTSSPPDQATANENGPGRSPIGARVALALRMAEDRLQRGRFREVGCLLGTVGAVEPAVRERVGGLHLAAAWAAYFMGADAKAVGQVARVFDCSQDPFVRGCAALCAGLAFRKLGQVDRGIASAALACRQLDLARQSGEGDEAERTLWLAQAQIARGAGGDALEDADRLAAGRTGEFADPLRKAVQLYRRFLAGEPVSEAVRNAVEGGVMRTWIAMLPGAERAARYTGMEAPVAPPVDVSGASGGDSDLRRRLLELRARTGASDSGIRTRKAPIGSILLVEPHDDRAAAFAACLAGSGHSIAARVGSLDAALQRISHVGASILVLDLQSPGVAVMDRMGASGTIQRILSVDPQARIVVTFPAVLRHLLMSSLRAGARAHVEQPFTAARVLGALHAALAARSGVETLRRNVLGLNRPHACSWRSAGGLLSSLLFGWRNFSARSLDPAGIDAVLSRGLSPGRIVRLRVQIPPWPEPLETEARIVSCRQDPVLHFWLTRFQFVRLPEDRREALTAYLTTILGRERPVQPAPAGG